MLRGSEVSKDSYHSPVKKIKTITGMKREPMKNDAVIIIIIIIIIVVYCELSKCN